MDIRSLNARRADTVPGRPPRQKTPLSRLWWLAVLVLLGGHASGPALASQQQPQVGPSAGGTPSKQTAGSGTQGERLNGAAQGKEPLSDAERVARLQRAVADNEKLLGELRSKLEDPQDEYAKAEAEFAKLDRDYQDKKKELQKQTDAGVVDLTTIETELAALEPQWKLAKERFDLAIKARKALQEQITALEQKARQDQDALKKITEVKPPAASEPQPVQTPGQAPLQETGTKATPAPTPGGTVSPVTVPQEPSPPEPSGTRPGATAPSLGASQPAAPSGPVVGTVAPSGEKPAPPSPQLAKAQEEANKKESEATEAAQEARSVSERIEALRKNIQLERSQLGNTRKRADNSQETERTLDEELQRRWTEGAERTELDGLRQKIADARQRFREARAEIKERTDRLDSLQSELTTLQAEELAAMRDAEVKRVEAEKARKKVEQLQNPFAPRNLLQWTVDHGPRILVILLSMAAIVWIARLLERRITDWMAHHGKRGAVEDENRARTLVGVLHNAIRVVVLIGGSLMILAELGVNIIPLMGGAAVLGLAAAFGGQNLLRDYFTGFMILMENQYGVNDVVKIGDVAGLVERITLRLTVLRDLDGRVHFIPNGHIATVSNLTQGWSRALFDIGVAYKEDVDRVMELLIEMGKELRRDPEFRHMILEQPEMLGVDQFGDSAVVIKFFIKTRPLMQWTVKREMLRRIKKRFDELGIEIPFPHRTVYHHYDSDDRPRAADDRPREEREAFLSEHGTQP